MKRSAFLIISALGLTFLAYFYWLNPRPGGSPAFALDEVAEVSYAPANSDLSSREGFLGSRMEEAMQHLLLSVAQGEPESAERSAGALQALSIYYQYVNNSGLKKPMKRLAEKVAVTPVSSSYEELASQDPEKRKAAARLLQSEMLGLLYYYRATGKGWALDNCLDKADSIQSHLKQQHPETAQYFLEPLALLYLFSGDEQYGDLCNILVQKEKAFLSPYNKFTKSQLVREKLSFLNGLLEVYRFRQDHTLLNFCRQAWTTISQERTPYEALTAWLQFNGAMYTFTGQMHYAGEIEQTIYNGLLAAQSLLESKNGDKIGGREEIAIGLAQVPAYLTGLRAGKLTVNIYETGSYQVRLPSEADVLPLSYTIDSHYPNNGTVEMSVFPGTAARFAISLRVPDWCTLFEVHAGEEVYKGQSGQYLDIERTWHDGDILRICMTMKIRQEKRGASYVLARGPQLLSSLGEVEELPSEWKGRQLYSLNTVKGKENQTLGLAPLADVFQRGIAPQPNPDSIRFIGELSSPALEELRSQLAAFRDEFGGANDLPDVKFFLFGMGNRAKFIYKDGALKTAFTGETIKSWAISHQSIVPNEYQVTLRTLDGAPVIIYENESGLYIQEGEQAPVLVEGTAEPILLPDFEAYQYAEIMKVLHHEILISIVDSRPLPNIFVYDTPWRRDAAMAAMCLEETGNQDLIKDWVLNLEAPYDYNNKIDGAPEEEADNLGQTLYLISLFAGKEHPMVQRVLGEVPKFEKNWFGKRYIEGHTDFGDRPNYQTKWLKYGLRKLGLEDPYQIPHDNNGYNTLFWWDYKDALKEEEDVEVWRFFPYISWAKDHFFGTKNSPISNRVYPLTWEIEASQADYEKMKLIDSQYFLEDNSSPHSWHTAEMFLYILDLKKK